MYRGESAVKIPCMGAALFIALAVLVAIAGFSRISRSLNQGPISNADRSTPPGHRSFVLAVHGESYVNDDGSSRQAILRRCKSGEAISLIPQPDNPFDNLAVRVCRQNGEQIGFLPAGHGLTKRIEQGVVGAVLERITGGVRGKPMRGAVLLVTVPE